MAAYKICGGRPLYGSVEIAGSKNATLALLSAVVLAEGRIVLRNVPSISDVRNKLELLQLLGAEFEWTEGTLFIDCTKIQRSEADKGNIQPTRTSFNLLGPLVARTGTAVLPAPGGCQIGPRPVDFHLKSLALLGIDITLNKGHYFASCKKVKGAEICLDFPSAGATQHIMSTATLAEGTTVIHNAAAEPEVVALGEFLNLMGAKIEGAGTNKITITGVAKLEACEYRIPFDRLQASTYLLAGIITRGEVTVKNVLPEHLTSLTNKLKEAETEVSEGNTWVKVAAPWKIKGVKVKTMPYPGFPTDLQQPIAAALCNAVGTSIIEDTIYEGRIGHVSQLCQMGAKIHLEGRSSIIEGVSNLNGAEVEASDLRAGAALCLAGLGASGETIVKNISLVDRGYEDFEIHLKNLGAKIERIGHTLKKEPLTSLGKEAL